MKIFSALYVRVMPNYIDRLGGVMVLAVLAVYFSI